MRYYVGNFFYGEDLLHYRTAGSKNGVRRYQNPDGSLTPEGRIHYNRPLPKKKRGLSVVEKLFGGKKASKKSADKAKPTKDKRKISDMSDEELRNKTSRKKIENEYLTEVKKGNELRKKKSNEFGKKLAETALAAGKDLLATYFKFALEQASANAEAERKRQAEDRKNAREDAKIAREEAKAAREEAEKKKNDSEKEAQEKEKRLYSNKYDRAKDKDLRSAAKANKVAGYLINGRSVVDGYLNPHRSGNSEKTEKQSDKFNQRDEQSNGSKQSEDGYSEYEYKRNKRGGGSYA